MEQDGLSGSLSDVGGMKPLHPVGLRPTCLHPPQCNRLAIRSLALSGCPPNLGGSNANVCSLVGAERRVRSRAQAVARSTASTAASAPGAASAATSSSAAAPASAAPAASARAIDGDYKARSAMTSQTKDSDGDYKPSAAANSASAQSSNAVQTSLLSLKKGG